MGRKLSPTPLPSQIKVFDALDRLTIKHKRPATIREIVRKTRKNTTSYVSYCLKAGVRFGRVVLIRKGNYRAYVPVWWKKMVDENVKKYSEAG